MFNLNDYVTELAAQVISDADLLAASYLEVSPGAGDIADTVCGRGTVECFNIIRRYENEAGGDFADATSGADTFNEAIEHYAEKIVYELLYNKTAETLREIQESAEAAEDTLTEWSEYFGNEEFAFSDCRFVSEPSFGWMAHNYENESGAMFWDNKPGGFFPALIENELVGAACPITDDAGNNYGYVEICFNPADYREAK